MARVTVEDCLDKIPNRFELVVLAARRARDITLGRAPFVERENDKPTVIALREIADGKIDLEYLTARESSAVDLLPTTESESDHEDTDKALAALLMEDAGEEEGVEKNEAAAAGEVEAQEDGEGRPTHEPDAPPDEDG